MHNWTEMYEIYSDVEIPKNIPLIAGLSGFADAGGAVAQLNEHFFAGGNGQLVASLKTDFFIDYRSRRPIMEFERDHLTNYEPHRISLHKMVDDVGHPFLYLSGLEPDFRWNAFVDILRDFIQMFQVSSVSWIHAIPMPVPHTRPMGVTVSGTRSDLNQSLSLWQPHTQVPVTVLHLLEYSLQEQGDISVVGFVLLVPHYLAETEYPGVVIAGLDALTTATGLMFPTEDLRQANRELTANIDEQVAHNAELARLVGALEERYDTFVQDNGHKVSLLVDKDGELPSADEIAAELELFLASDWRSDKEQGSEGAGADD